MPLKSAEKKAADAAEMRARLTGEPEPAVLPFRSKHLERDALRTLERLNRAVRNWRRRHPEQPIVKIEITDRGVSFDCERPS